jgi:F-box/leucine-rich repeat protein 2/20
VQAVATHCPRLTSLYAERAGAIDDQAIASLAHGCAGLSYLDLGMQETISDAALIVLAERCRQLRSLSVAYCKVRCSTKLLTSRGLSMRSGSHRLTAR